MIRISTAKKPVAIHSTVSPVFHLFHLYAFPAVAHSVVCLPYGMVDLPLGVVVTALISSLEHAVGTVVTAPDERVVVSAFGCELPNAFPVAAHSFV